MTASSISHCIQTVSPTRAGMSLLSTAFYYCNKHTIKVHSHVLASLANKGSIEKNISNYSNIIWTTGNGEIGIGSMIMKTDGPSSSTFEPMLVPFNVLLVTGTFNIDNYAIGYILMHHSHSIEVFCHWKEWRRDTEPIQTKIPEVSCASNTNPNLPVAKDNVRTNIPRGICVLGWGDGEIATGGMSKKTERTLIMHFWANIRSLWYIPCYWVIYHRLLCHRVCSYALLHSHCVDAWLPLDGVTTQERESFQTKIPEASWVSNTNRKRLVA